MAYGLWDVQDSFVIPGTRDKATFGPVRVSAPTMAKASQGRGPHVAREVRQGGQGHRSPPLQVRP